MKTRQELAQHLFRGTGVELGVAWGEFSEVILRAKTPLPLLPPNAQLPSLWDGMSQSEIRSSLPNVDRLYSIDRWTEAHHDTDEYLQALTRLSHYGRRSVVLRATFDAGAVLFEPESLDFVYVDGYAHTGQEGGKTLEDWWPKIKPGGVLAGHDYDALFQPTIDAVDAFVARHRLEMHLTEEAKLRSWWVVKQG